MPTIDQMAAKGKAKYAAKKASMVTNYQAAIGRAVTNYKTVGFGPSMTRNYETGLNIGKAFYTSDRLDENKWEQRWLAKARA